MKAALFSATLVVLMAVVVQCQNPNFQQLMKQCMDETKMTEAELKEFMTGGMKSTTNENLKCYTKCLMEKQGHMVNGQFNADALLNTLRNVPQMKDKMDEITSGVNACKDLKGTNDCDTAFKITMCLKEHKTMGPHPGAH
ncbi:general odorant-binding protein 56h [Drosophila sulfurigaster albostrigata]|uniref:general odorant-binding protein 56h n=1 Tax=Drosophila nasuta TaxID=42062 RepID=UPI00295E65B5|nr:general odorant-binding protein 56h [Drosophila nasuta]XP_062130775.1 general odorant-binding protein 56h [Drosophila sulfurigaster albostrigata]